MDEDATLDAQLDAQAYQVGDSIFLETKSTVWIAAVITETKLGGYRIFVVDSVHTKWGIDQWFQAEQLSFFPRNMEGVRGHTNDDWDIFSGNDVAANLLPQVKPTDRSHASIYVFWSE
jgi:hypothetical protein